MSKRYLVVPKADGLLQSKQAIEFNIFVKHLADVEGHSIRLGGR
jgi:hypothetical protein